MKSDNFIGTLKEVSFGGYRVSCSNWHEVDFSKYKLLLRPLSDITPEEKNSFINICELEPEDAECLTIFKDRFFDGQVGYGTAHLTNIEQWATGVYFLLSREFDLFGLIENGWAIDKTQLEVVS
jgi:hypothetical protein